MFDKLRAHKDDMLIAFVVWLCILPLVGLFVVPFLGLKAGLIAALVLFIAVFWLCWGICFWKAIRNDYHHH